MLEKNSINTLFKPYKKEVPVSLKKEKPAITAKSKLMYDNKYTFNDYRNVRKYYDLSFKAKYDKSLSFYHRLNKFRNLVPRIEKNKIEKEEHL